MSTRRLLTVGLVAYTACGQAAAKPPVESPAAEGSLPEFDDAVTQAHDDGKPLVVAFMTSWCGVCQRFREGILPDDRVQAALGDVTFVSYDAEDGPGLEAAARFGVAGYPTFIRFDANGGEMETVAGLQGGPDWFAGFLGRAAAEGLDEAQVDARVAASPDDAMPRLLKARWLVAHHRRAEALVEYAKAVAADPDDQQGIGADAAWECQTLRRAIARRKAAAKDAAAHLRQFPGSSHAIDALYLAGLSGELPADEVAELFALHVAAVPDDPVALNNAVYLALAAGAYDAALTAAERQVELAPDEANPYDSLAEVHHYRGDREKALAAEDQAIERATRAEKEVLEENRARYERDEGEPSRDVEANRDRAEELMAAEAD